MRLSVIIPVYNSEKHLSRCLDSLLDQGLQQHDFEILIVNDGSTDGSRRIAEHYAQENACVTIINKKNGGAGSARNLGMDYAKGDYVYFIDSDDYLMPNCLDILLERSDLYDLDILTFLTKSVHSSDDSVTESHNFNFSFGDALCSPILTGEAYVANVNYKNEVWWYLINREFLKKSEIRFLEGRWLEDVIVSINLILKSNRIAHLRLDAHRQVITDGSAMTNRESEHYLEIIRDIQYAALNFDPIIKSLERKQANPDCIMRVKTRQQSLVFFSMIRMLKSKMSFEEVKIRMNEMKRINAYPLDSFLGKDYSGIVYQILTRLFKTENRYYFLFRMINPVFRLQHKVMKAI